MMLHTAPVIDVINRQFHKMEFMDRISPQKGIIILTTAMTIMLNVMGIAKTVDI